METISLIIDTTVHFILNWNTYFCSIPLWFIIWVLFTKYSTGELTVKDVFVCIFLSFLNPILYIVIIWSILFSPIIFLGITWSKIKDKRIW